MLTANRVATGTGAGQSYGTPATQGLLPKPANFDRAVSLCGWHDVCFRHALRCRNRAVFISRHLPPTADHTTGALDRIPPPLRRAAGRFSHTAEARRDISAPFRRAPERRRDTPEAWRHTSESSRRAPEGRRGAPEPFRYASEPWRDTPEPFRRAPESWRDAPESSRCACFEPKQAKTPEKHTFSLPNREH